MKVKEIILDILFPRVCVGCGKEGKYICDKCKVFISESEPTETRVPENLDGLISVWDYEGLIKELIQMIKYQGITDIIKELVSSVVLSEAKNPVDYQRDPSAYGLRMTMPPIVTYVPMYLRREKERGFNQAELIAKELAKRANPRPVLGQLLEKVVDTEDQAKLSKEERLENVKNSFRAVGRGRASVLLVDDVFTTGATMNECCKVLKKAGIKKVWGFTLARTP